MVNLVPYIAEIVRCDGAPVRDRGNMEALAMQGRHMESDTTKVSNSKALDGARLCAESCNYVLSMGFEPNSVFE
jgi:hypothetical protein